MIQLKIDNIEIQVSEGTTVLEAARQAGIHIPSMCYKGGHENHPSCMVCLVKDKKTGNITTSCALPAVEGMEYISNDPLVIDARKEALELLMSDHVGDCEAPCSLACPANMNIPQMNRLIAANKFEESLKVVKEDIALPYVLGYICPAPCEKACRRKQVDDAVSVCLLKRSVAAEHKNSVAKPPLSQRRGEGGEVLNNGVAIAIIGSGPAGLAAAYYLAKYGYSCVVFDKNEKSGGTLRYSIPDEELPKSVIDSEVDIIQGLGVEFRFNTPISTENFESEIRNKFKAIIIATGDVSVSNPMADLFQFTKTGIAAEDGTFSTSIPGIFACGSIIRAQKMAVRAVAQGKAAAESAHRYLQGKPLEKPSRRFNSRFDKLVPAEFPEYLKESVSDTRYSPKDGYLKGFSREEAIQEAMRCMHCDCRKLDSCKLRSYSDQYKVDRKKYLIGERKLMTKHYQHEIVVYEPEKCIKCGLCIDITLKNNELIGLTYIGRGFDVRMDASLGANMSEAITHTAKLCVDSCPTGALSMKKE